MEMSPTYTDMYVKTMPSVIEISVVKHQRFSDVRMCNGDPITTKIVVQTYTVVNSERNILTTGGH